MRHRCHSSSLHGVQDVLSLRYPLQILQAVVVSVSVLMVDHKPLVIAEKRLSDKPVDISDDSLAPIVAEGHTHVSVLRQLQQPWAIGAKQPFDLALGAHDVSALETGYR